MDNSDSIAIKMFDSKSQSEWGGGGLLATTFCSMTFIENLRLWEASPDKKLSLMVKNQHQSHNKHNTTNSVHKEYWDRHIC